MVLDYLAAALAVLWFGITLAVWRNLRALRDLPAAETPAEPPRVAVVFAARDEARRVGETVQRLLAQRDVELQIVAVNDRSRDDTGAILDQLAAREPRLTVRHVTELPAGWLGKCHALWLGAQQADAEWLLFTDADIHMRDDLLARAVAAARRDAADHLTLWPGLTTRSLFARACLLAFGQLFSLYAPTSQINRDRGRRGLGVGAFNLIRREAYQAIGGHAALQLEVLDDVELGMLVRQAGRRQRVYSGMTELEAEWADSAWGMVRSIEKNWFAGVNYSFVQAAVSIAAMLGLWLGAATAPAWSPAWGWLALAAVWSPMLPAVHQSTRMGWPRRPALLTPLGYPLFALAGIHSTLQALRHNGIHWRDTFYPLKTLRAGRARGVKAPHRAAE